jgi:GTP cyclohydrolase IA
MKAIKTIDIEELTRLTAEVIPLVDGDPAREGLRQTPQRYAKFLKEFLDTQDFNFTVFDGQGYDEMIVQTGIPFYSLCEHHLVPFFGTATIAYIPDKKIVGLSKLARVLTHFSHNLQNQERITKQVADFIDDKLHPSGVGVTLIARHLCMEMRGVQMPGTRTTTTFVKGLFKDDQATRAEFLNYAAPPQ